MKISSCWLTLQRKPAKTEIETEMYVYYGTNEYNFEVLDNPPKYEKKKCCKCNRIIKLSEESVTIGKEGYTCSDCFKINF